jgi:hypothetical protein
MSGYSLERKVHDGRSEQTLLIPVEDGKWVVPHVGTSYSYEAVYDEQGGLLHSERLVSAYVVVGSEPVRHVLARSSTRFVAHRGGGSNNALVGDRPFGVILTEEENGHEQFGLRFVCARQIHKGELGQRPMIVRPRFAREAPASDAVVSSLTERPIRRRDLRRGKIGWARLADVAALLGMDAKELILRYVRFVHAEHAVLDVHFAERFEEIHGKPARQPEHFSAYALEKLFSRDLDTAWIRKGFACTALYLHHLGHVPEPHPTVMSRTELVRETSVIVP